MAKITVQFQANTTGIHYIGYRTYNFPTLGDPTDWEVLEHDVTTPGAQQVDIPVPENMYCADHGVKYWYWIIADCQDQTDGNSDGVPDLATLYDVTLVQQTDPCIKTEIACDNVGVYSVTMTNKGSGYTSPPTVSFTPTGGGGAGAAATAVLGNGIITAIDAWTPGSGYHIANANSTQTVNVLRATQAGTTGSGMTADVTFDAGAVITNIVLNAAGSGYDTADDAAPLTIDLTSLTDGTAPAVEATIDVSCTGDFADEVSFITMTNNGSAYDAVPTVGFAGGGGSSAAGTANMQDCPNIDLADFVCEGETQLSDNAEYALALGETVVICADDSTFAGVPLPSQYVQTPQGNCHCEGCAEVTISVPGATAGTGKVSYQVCWDGNHVEDAVWLVSRSVDWDEVINLGCIIEDTLNISNKGLIGGVITVASSVACTAP